MAFSNNLQFIRSQAGVTQEQLAEQLDVDPAKITMDSDIMSDFEADSLDIVDMVMTLEDEFGIEVPDDAIENLRTVGDVVKFVDSHKG